MKVQTVRMERAPDRAYVHLLLALAILLALLPQALLAAPQQAAPHAAPHAAPRSAADPCAAEAPGATAPEQAHRVFLPMAIRSAIPEAESSVPRRLAYQAGKTYSYALTLALASDTYVQSAGAAPQRAAQTTTLRAIADVAISGQSEAGFAGQITLREVVVCSSAGGATQRMDSDTMAAGLAVPLHFVQGADGVVRAVRHAQGAPTDATNLQKAVLNALQATLQEQGDRYTVQEQGTQGRYTADYTLHAEPGVLRVTRRYGGDALVAPAGDPLPPSFSLSDRAELTLNARLGVFTSVEQVQTLATGAAAAVTDGFDGTATWTEFQSRSHLRLVEIASTAKAADAAGALVETTLAATVVAEGPESIDLSGVNLEAELAALEAAALRQESEPQPFVEQARRVWEMAKGDASGVVVASMATRLPAQRTNPLLANVYVDMLGALGSADAQAILAAVLAGGYDAATQRQALVTAAQVAAPSPALMQALQQASRDAASPLHATALTALGAAAANLGGDAQAAVAAEIEAGLVATAGIEEVEARLAALGNIGHASSFAAISRYAGSEAQAVAAAGLPDGDAEALAANTESVRATALMALRHLPGGDADALLAAVAGDAQEPEGLRALAANVLAERNGAAADAAESAEAASPDASYVKTWTRTWGSSKLGIMMPGSVTAKSPPHATGLKLYARQDVDGYIWYRKIDLLAGYIDSYRYSSSQQYFRAAIIVNSSRVIFDQTIYLSCSGSMSNTLYRMSWTIYQASHTIVVYGVPVTFEASLSGSVGVASAVRTSLCSPADMMVIVGVIPNGYITATGKASVGWKGIARVGVAVEGTILNTSLPAYAGLRATTSSVRLCIEAEATTQPLSVRLYAWKDWFFRSDEFATLARVSLGKYRAVLLNRCY